MSRRRLGFVLALVGMAVGPADLSRAQTGRALTLQEALRTALDNNLDLVSSRVDPEVAEQQVEGQRGTFDPVFSALVFGQGFDSEPRDRFTSPGIGQTLGARAEIADRFQFGGDLSLSMQSTRRTGAGSIFDVFGLDDAFLESTAEVTFNMPLLRNFGTEVTTEQLVLAAGSLEISRQTFRSQVELTLEQVEGAYWDVLAAIRQLQVNREALQRAQDLLELNRKKVEVGTLAPIEITQAEAGVASQEEGVLVAQQTLDNAEDELRRLMAIPAADPLWGTPIDPTDRPDFRPRSVDLEASIEEALANRPELERARADLQNRELSERAARNRTRPGLDLALQFRPEGNNSLLDPVDPVGSYPDSLSEMFEGDFFSWAGSLNFSVPIGNRAAKADYRIATLQKGKSEVDLENQAQTVRVEVRSAVRAVETGSKRVEAAAKNVQLQREKLEAEQKKFENGMSTSFEVLTFQNDLSTAELAEVRARLDYIKALAALERSKGTLLQARGMSIAPSEPQ